MARVVIFVEGGVVQQVIRDAAELEVMIINYDDEESDPKPRRSFEPVVYEPDLVDSVLAGAE